MIEEKAFYQPLHRIEQIVMTSDMSQFMQQNGFDLFDRQTREQVNGNQDDRPEMAQGERDIDQAGLKHLHRPSNLHPGAQLSKLILPNF